MVQLDIGLAYVVQEAFVHQFQYPFLVLVADGVLEQGAFLADPRAGLEAPVPCGQRQAVGPATAVAGQHKNGGGFAPDFQLFQRADRLLLIQRGHGHDQCRRAAGKFRCLGVVGHRQEFPGRLVIQNAPFEPQGVAVVFVVIPIGAELAIAQPLVKIDGAGVVFPNFQAHQNPVCFYRFFLCLTNQLLAHAPATNRG